MFKFKNPDNSETKSVKSSTKKKGSVKFKNDINKSAPFSEWIYRLFMLLAFISLIMIVIYIGAAAVSLITGYFAGATGIVIGESVYQSLDHVNLYTLLYNVAFTFFFVVLILYAVIAGVKALFRYFVLKKIGKSFAEYKK